jgi:hypothetical protein
LRVILLEFGKGGRSTLERGTSYWMEWPMRRRGWRNEQEWGVLMSRQVQVSQAAARLVLSFCDRQVMSTTHISHAPCFVDQTCSLCVFRMDRHVEKCDPRDSARSLGSKSWWRAVCMCEMHLTLMMTYSTTNRSDERWIQLSYKTRV